MHLAIGKVSALAARVLSTRPANSESPVEEPRPTPPVAHDLEAAPEPEPEALSAVGRENENVRRRHEEIFRKAQWLVSLQDDLADAFGHSERTLEDLARTKLELAKLEAIGKFEHEAHEEAIQRAEALREASERANSELELLRPEATRLAKAARDSAARLQALEGEHATLREAHAQMQIELAKEVGAGKFLWQDLDAARAELQTADALIEQQRFENAQLTQKLEIADETARALNQSGEDLHRQLARSAADLDKERAALTEARARITSLESQLDERQREHARLRAQWQSEADQFRSEIGELRGQATHAAAVEAVQERMAQDLQAEVKSKNEELRRAERRAAEAESAAAQAAEKLKDAQIARAKAEANRVSGRSMHQTLARRFKPLIQALRAERNDGKQKRAVIADLETRLEHKTHELNLHSRKSEARAAALIAELEAERSRRILLEGALSVNREVSGVRSTPDPASTQLMGPTPPDPTDSGSPTWAKRPLLRRAADIKDRNKSRRRHEPGDAA